MTILVNGQKTDTINITDRGLNYGDGLFETMRVQNEQVRLLDDHIERLLKGCERLGFEPPANVSDEVRAAAAEQEQGIVKLIVTRGSGGRGYRPQVGLNATRILMTSPLSPEPDILAKSGGIRAGLSSVRLARQPSLAGIKHLNRLEQVLAAREAGEYEERIMLDTDGNVIEGIAMNLFLVRDGALVTPDMTAAGVAGIMRRQVMELAQNSGIACIERAVQPAELDDADEAFMCNAVRGIWPLIAIQGRSLPVGPLTRRVVAALGEIWP
ncbi:MAG TPA: aminodeoxychorismate lyase [Gammaproteobacteria bacterium]|nr:aminodeoxychorismate lyase [Gammaproteobacteria bacterium]